MATVKENLIAARALIDTPEKYETARKNCGTAIGYAIVEARGSPDGELPLLDAICRAWRCGDGDSFDATMALFDRAIAAQDEAS